MMSLPCTPSPAAMRGATSRVTNRTAASVTRLPPRPSSPAVSAPAADDDNRASDIETVPGELTLRTQAVAGSVSAIELALAALAEIESTPATPAAMPRVVPDDRLVPPSVAACAELKEQNESEHGTGDFRGFKHGRDVGAGREAVEGLGRTALDVSAGTEAKVECLPASASKSAAALAAAAAAALQAGDTSLSGDPVAVLVPGDRDREGVLPLPPTRGFRVSGTYTEAAIAVVRAATATTAARKTDTSTVLRTQSHGKSRVAGDSTRPTPVKNDNETLASAPQDLNLRGSLCEKSVISVRSPPPGPSAIIHRREAARKRKMIRGLRLLPATTVTPLEVLDRSKLAPSPTKLLRPRPSSQSSERASWVSVTGQATSTVAAAETVINKEQATCRKSSSPMSPLMATSSSTTKPSVFFAGQTPRYPHKPLPSSTSPLGDGNGLGAITSAPVSPLVAMPTVEDSAREIGRRKPAEDKETELTWAIGMKALGKGSSSCTFSWGGDTASSSPEVARAPSATVTDPVPADAAPTVIDLPSACSCGGDSDGDGVESGNLSPNTAAAAALGAALTTAMASHKRVGGRKGTEGDGLEAPDGDLPRLLSSATARKSSVLMQRGGKEVGLREGAGADELGPWEDGGDPSHRSRWREVRDRTRESTGMGPASMARARYAASGARLTSPVFERSALPTLSQLRRQGPKMFSPRLSSKAPPTESQLESAREAMDPATALHVDGEGGNTISVISDMISSVTSPRKSAHRSEGVDDDAEMITEIKEVSLSPVRDLKVTEPILAEATAGKLTTDRYYSNIAIPEPAQSILDPVAFVVGERNNEPPVVFAVATVEKEATSGAAEEEATSGAVEEEATSCAAEKEVTLGAVEEKATSGVAEEEATSSASTTSVVVAGFSNTDDPRRSSAGAPPAFGDERSLNVSGVSMENSLPRIRSEGGLVRRTGGLVAGKPIKPKSGFVPPGAIKQGLGPAGAFAGNANWRVEVAREKNPFIADVKADGHGGFHNPMAALRAQKHQQERQQHHQQRYPWVGKVAPGVEWFPAEDETSTALATDASNEKSSSGERLPPIPAWMINKGMGGGARTLRNRPGVLLGRPRPAHGRILRGGGEVGPGVGGSGSSSLPSGLAFKQQPFSPTAVAVVAPHTSEAWDGAALCVGDDHCDRQEGCSLSTGAVSTRDAGNALEDRGQSRPDKPPDETSTATTAALAAVAAAMAVTFGVDGSSGPLVLTREESAGCDSAVSSEVATPYAGKTSSPRSGGGGAAVFPPNEVSPTEAMDAMDISDDSRSTLSEEASTAAASTVGAEVEEESVKDPLVIAAVDSRAKLIDEEDGEPLETPSSPGASGGFAALGRFLFGDHPGSQRAQIAPGEEVELRGKLRRESSSSVAFDNVERVEAQILLSVRSMDDYDGEGDTDGYGEGGGIASSVDLVSVYGVASRVSGEESLSTVSPERVGSSSSDCTTAPNSSADGDGNHDGNDDADGEASEADMRSAGGVSLASTKAPRLAPRSILAAVPPGAADEKAWAREWKSTGEDSINPFNDVALPPSLVEVPSPAVSGSFGEENAERTVTEATAKEASESQVSLLHNAQMIAPSVSVVAADGLDGGGCAVAAEMRAEANVADVATAQGFDVSRPGAGEQGVGEGPVATAVATTTRMSMASSSSGDVSWMRNSGRMRSRSSTRGVGYASSPSSTSGDGPTTTFDRTALLLSGERKTGLAALEHQGPTAKAARRALLEESKQRRSAEIKPRLNIFETLRQRSAASSHAAERTSSATRRQRYTVTRSVSERPTRAPSPRQRYPATRGISERLIRAPSPRRPHQTFGTNSAPPSRRVTVASASDPPKRSSNAVEGHKAMAVENGVVSAATGEGVGGLTIDALEEVADDQVEPASSGEDEEPDFWSMYGVIDTAALEEDADIEI